jgi:mannuronan 5-epimerase
VTDDVFLYNGVNGFHANLADNLDLERNRIAYSNEEHFSIVPSSAAQIAGAKVTTTQHAVVRANLVTDNWCNGLWVDVSSYDAVIANNAVLRNSGQGIGFEISAKGVIAGNVSADNGRDGIKVSGVTSVDVWNNTLVRNGWAQLGVYEDPRRNTNAVQIALGITWDTARVTAFNNILEATSTATRPVFESFDASSPRWTTTNAMLVADDDNLWGRPVAATPVYMASWQQNLTTTSRFTTLAALQSAVAREASSLNADGVALTSLFVDPAHGDFTLAPGSMGWSLGAPVPANVAAAMGVSPGSTPRRGALAVP